MATCARSTRSRTSAPVSGAKDASPPARGRTPRTATVPCSPPSRGHLRRPRRPVQASPAVAWPPCRPCAQPDGPPHRPVGRVDPVPRRATSPSSDPAGRGSTGKPVAVASHQPVAQRCHPRARRHEEEPSRDGPRRRRGHEGEGDGTGTLLDMGPVGPPCRSGQVVRCQLQLGRPVIGKPLPGDRHRRTLPGPPSGHPVRRSRAEPTGTVVDQRRPGVVHGGRLPVAAQRPPGPRA